MPAPATVSVMLWGFMGVSGKPRRTPSMSAATSAAVPAVTCTTVPPAKSIRPSSPSQPPPQTQWHTGTYTSITQAALKISMAEKRIRSAKPPTISAGVITAKVSWNAAKATSGIVPDRVSAPMPLNITRPKPPIQPLPPSKARL